MSHKAANSHISSQPDIQTDGQTAIIKSHNINLLTKKMQNSFLTLIKMYVYYVK